ncbi:hypothetical protein CO251_02750 [Sulfobacillus sp. hq2]|nr:hypothetical protein CO251_02750 [Sulfobacillus sp. hq2]
MKRFEARLVKGLKRSIIRIFHKVSSSFEWDMGSLLTLMVRVYISRRLMVGSVLHLKLTSDDDRGAMIGLTSYEESVNKGSLLWGRDEQLYRHGSMEGLTAKYYTSYSKRNQSIGL